MQGRRRTHAGLKQYGIDQGIQVSLLRTLSLGSIMPLWLHFPEKLGLLMNSWRPFPTEGEALFKLLTLAHSGLKEIIDARNDTSTSSSADDPDDHSLPHADNKTSQVSLRWFHADIAAVLRMLLQIGT